MRWNFKKISALSFLPVFLWSVFFCCCKTPLVQAASCHQAKFKNTTCAMHGHQQKSGSCSCKQNVAAEKEKLILKSSLDQNDISLILVRTSSDLTFDHFRYFESPPGSEQSSPPLYILDRVLRL
jgi:hypothetical protein